MPRPDVVGKTMKKLSVESCSKLIEPLHVDCASGFREKFSVGKFLTKAKKNFIYAHEISLRIMVQRETQTSGFCAFFIAQGPQQKRLKWTFT